MKYCFLLFMIFPGIAQSQNLSALLLSQLSEVNTHWLTMPVNKDIVHPSSMATNEFELVRQHLQQVENQLRQTNTSHLNIQQKENRNFCLEQLHAYWSKGEFPKNTDYIYRTPYFIDLFSNYCAVGYLLKQTGYDDVAQKIHRQHNNAYLKELAFKYPEIGQWANHYGFTLHELAWIQPTYGQSFYYADTSTITYANTFTIHPSTCLSLNDGGVSLPFHPYPYVSVKVLTYFGSVFPIGYTMPTSNLTSGMGSGYYSIIAIDSQNDTTIFPNFSIPYTDTPTVDITVTHELCNQPCTGSIVMNNAVDAVPPLLYSLSLGNSSSLQSSNVFNNVCAGSYFFAGIVDSRGCYGELSFNTMPTINGQLSANYSITTPIPCFGGQGAVNVTATGGTPPYTNTGIHWFAAGTHSIIVTDNVGCSDTVTFTMNNPPPLSISVSSTPDNGFGNGTASAITTGGIPPYEYLWSTWDTTWTIYNLVAGNYTIHVTDMNGCTITDQVIVYLSSPTGLDNKNSNGIRLYPNPAKNYVFIESEINEIYSIAMYDLMGRKIDMNLTRKNNTWRLNFGSLSNGTYLVLLQRIDGKSIIKNLIVD